MFQSKLLRKVLEVLKDNHIDYMLTGSLVSSLQGEPRATHDIDVVINILPLSIPALSRCFPAPQYYLSEQSIKEAIEYKSMFNLLDINEGYKVDFWILTNEPFDLSRFERKYEEDVFGITIKLSKPEDTILAKLRWAKISGGSEKQFTDALRVYEVQFGKLDLNYLEEWANRLGVNELWNKIKSGANPL